MVTHEDKSEMLKGVELLSNSFIYALTDPNFEAEQKRKQQILDSCLFVDWVDDMGNRIPFCKKTGEFCNYCK